MASFINSIRNMTGDGWWFAKIGLCSAALFYILYNEYDYPINDQRILIAKTVLVAIFLGIATVSMNRNITNKIPFFPKIVDIPETILKIIGSCILVIPGIAAYYYAFKYISTYEMEPFVAFVVYTLTICLLTPLIYIPLVLYAARGKFTDGFRINILFNGAGNVIVQSLSYIIQAGIIGGAIVISIYYMLLQMLGDHVSLLILKSIVLVILFFSTFSYASDMYGEGIPEIEEKVSVPKAKGKDRRDRRHKRH